MTSAATAYRGKAQDHGSSQAAEGVSGNRYILVENLIGRGHFKPRTSRELSAMADALLDANPVSDDVEYSWIDPQVQEYEEHLRSEMEEAANAAHFFEDEEPENYSFFTGSLVSPEDLGWPPRRRCRGYSPNVDTTERWYYPDCDDNGGYLGRSA